MKDFKQDQKIKQIFNKKEFVPDNINNIFDNFINENLQKQAIKNNVINMKSSKIKKIISFVASFFLAIVASGTIYAVVTGQSLIGLFNINEDKYKKHVVSVNEQISDSDISITLEDYAIDNNAVILNYNISSNKKLNFIKGEENIVATTYVNKNIHIDIDKQNYLEDNNLYKLSTLYSIEQFESVLDEFELNIKISKIAGVSGNWEFNVNMNKSDIIENKTYSFYDDISMKDTNRIAIKTNYTPISMNVKDVSVSDFSTMMNITIFSTQNGVKEENKIEPKKAISALSEEYKDERWNETENFIFEIKDNYGNELALLNYSYIRDEWIKDEKILFPNLNPEISELTFNIYLNNENDEKELVGNIKLDLSKEKDNTKNELDTIKTLDKGNIICKVPSKWEINVENNFIDIRTNDNYGNLISIQFGEFSEEKIKEVGIDKSNMDLEKIATNNSSFKYDISSADESKIISKGIETIGDFEGYQITYSIKTTLLNRSNWTQTKNFWFEKDGKLYLASIDADSEIAVDNNMQLFEEFIENIQIKN